ncbi:SDR family oxidoreductase [Flavobacterium soyangense]|uniref:SDR family oxidoreductase n=1 Tax=Flavobacterium soyangense TaxID=2023265 RepID=A0A930UER2_9FLAO|nr:SDR family oxidoreductase [Flavobacterium soyangense]MBF2709542.1 SDR family oxidoreductase [Flavobacterium soyangense]
MSASKKVIVITGTSSGFGKLSAFQLSLDGHQIYAGMRNPLGSNLETKNELEQFAKDKNVFIKVIDLDVTDDKSVENAIEAVAKEAGTIDVLINNAGQMFVGVTEAFTIEDIKKQMDVNFFGSVRTDRAVLPYMKSQKSGLIIHVSSLSGRVVFPFFGVYSASKFAMEAYAEAFRYELSGLGIDSVIVQPGPFGTSLLGKSPEPSDKSRLEAYGALAGVPDLMKTNFQAMYDGENAPIPQDVADAIKALVDSNDKRPLRTVVMPRGMDFGVAKLNEGVSEVQNDLLKMLQFDSMI